MPLFRSWRLTVLCAVTHSPQRIVDGALSRTRERQALPNLAELIAQLEEARAVALSTFPPQASAAVNATLAWGGCWGLSLTSMPSPSADRTNSGPLSERK